MNLGHVQEMIRVREADKQGRNLRRKPRDAVAETVDRVPFDPVADKAILIGRGAVSNGGTKYEVAIGIGATTNGTNAVAIGSYGATANANATAVGSEADANEDGSTVIGSHLKANK